MGQGFKHAAPATSLLCRAAPRGRTSSFGRGSGCLAMHVMDTRWRGTAGPTARRVQVFEALNKIELRSLEEIRFLMSQFAREPAACLQLLKYLPLNTGDVAARHIRDPELLAFVNAECFLWSTVLADATPMISAGMVLCDRFFGGINYPVGGVGEIPRKLVAGLQARTPPPPILRCTTSLYNVWDSPSQILARSRTHS